MMRLLYDATVLNSHSDGRHRIFQFCRAPFCLPAGSSRAAPPCRCRVPVGDVILGEGRGFEIAQGRLGPGRLHHCMRACGIGRAALQLAAARVQGRQTFGQPLHSSPLVQAQLAHAWLRLHSAWCVPAHLMQVQPPPSMLA